MVDLEDPEAHSFRSDILDYARAGMEVRLVDDLPIKLVVFDRATVLVAILDDHVSSYPDLLLVEDRGFAQVMAAIFEQWWAGARVLSTTMPESGCR